MMGYPAPPRDGFPRRSRCRPWALSAKAIASLASPWLAGCARTAAQLIALVPPRLAGSHLLRRSGCFGGPLDDRWQPACWGGPAWTPLFDQPHRLVRDRCRLPLIPGPVRRGRHVGLSGRPRAPQQGAAPAPYGWGRLPPLQGVSMYAESPLLPRRRPLARRATASLEES